MSDFNFDDIEEMTVELELEDGQMLECEVVYIFEWNGMDIAVLTPTDESIDEIYFFGIEITQKRGKDPEITLMQIDDDDTLEAIGEAFDEMISEEEESDIYGVDDDDEEEEEEEDGKWDEFINKKLDWPNKDN